MHFLVQKDRIFNKQLLDEVEHDIMNDQNRGLIIQTRGFDHSWYHAKTEFNNCFIINFLNNRQKKTFSHSVSEFFEFWIFYS